MENIQDIKNKVLFKAISYITIVSVDEKENFDGSLTLYIKTNDLNTVDLDNLEILASDLTTDSFEVQITKPEYKVIGSSRRENKDTVAVYIS
jgi:hypothetical protein